jgi:hypothetical protein
MDPVFLMQLLILAGSSGLLTELMKWLTELTGMKVPPNLIPALSTFMGGLQSAGLPLAGVDDGPSVAVGAMAGLAGTGLHQVLFANRYVKSGLAQATRKKAAWLLPLLVSWPLIGCASDSTVKARQVAQEACQRVPQAQAAANLANQLLTELPPGTDAAQAKQDAEQAARVLAHLKALCAVVTPPS